MFIGGVILGKVTNFAACMESPKELEKCNHSNVNIRKISTKTGSKNSVLDAMNNIRDKFLECCRGFIPDTKYKEKVNYFLEILDELKFFDEKLIKYTVNFLVVFFEAMDDKDRATFADLWQNENFDKTAVRGFARLFSKTDIFQLGFVEGFNLFLKGSDKIVIVQFFRGLDKDDYKILDGFSAFLACVGYSTIETGFSFGKFDTYRVFLALNKLLLGDDGDIDYDAFLGLMRVIRGFEYDCPSLKNFVAILADVSASVSEEVFASLLREFSYLEEKDADWASKNFANMLDCKCRENYRLLCKCFVSYKVKERIEDAYSFDTEKFVKGLAAIKPESFIPEEFAKSQNIKEVVVSFGPSDDLDYHLND